MATLCRECLESFELLSAAGDRCAACGSPRLVSHPALDQLAIAHIDCDAFYASVEKRDQPELRDRPVIVGGGKRGVVAAACYVARLYGIHSAMPMFKALKACPDVVVIRPDMAKYQRIGQRIREMMRALTPLVEPLSIDEAFLDLTGTEALHGGPPARTLARLILRVEDELGLKEFRERAGEHYANAQLLGEANRSEAANDTTFENALDLLVRRGVIIRRSTPGKGWSKEPLCARGENWQDLRVLTEHLAAALASR